MDDGKTKRKTAADGKGNGRDGWKGARQSDHEETTPGDRKGRRDCALGGQERENEGVK